MSDKPLIEKPNTTQVPTKKCPQIFVMPEKYRGGKNQVKMHQPAKKPPIKVVPAKTAAPPKPQVDKKAEDQKIKKPKQAPGLISKKLVYIGLVLIGLLIIAALVVVFAFNPESEVVLDPDPVVFDPDPIVVLDPDPVDPDPIVVNPDPVDPDPVDPFATELSPGQDSDSDGLTDLEEILFATDPKLPDTDSDGFLDGNEVFHRYHPDGQAPFTLLDSGVVKVFEGEDFSYSIFHPSAWTVSVVGGPSEQVIFTADSGEVIQVIVNVKLVDQTVTDWFLTQDTQANADDLLSFTSKEQIVGVMSPDRMTAYLDGQDKVYLISYNAGTKVTVDYLQTFQMMLNSLLFISE